MATVSAESKILAVKQYYSGEGSLNQIAAKFGVRRSTLQKWQLNYDLFGEDGLRQPALDSHTNRSMAGYKDTKRPAWRD